MLLGVPTATGGAAQMNVLIVGAQTPMWVAIGLAVAAMTYKLTYMATRLAELAYHRRVMKQLAGKRAMLEAPPWGGTEIARKHAEANEQLIQTQNRRIDQLERQVNSQGGGDSKRQVTKRAKVAATTPHVEDDPRWEWRDGNWVARSMRVTAAHDAARIAAAFSVPPHVVGPIHLRLGDGTELTFNDPLRYPGP